MKDGRKRCAECGESSGPVRGDVDGRGGHCPACGAPLDRSALSAFADRLARFGLGDGSDPLLSNPPELPNG